MREERPPTYQAAGLALVLEGAVVIAVLATVVTGTQLSSRLIAFRLDPGSVAVAIVWVVGLTALSFVDVIGLGYRAASDRPPGSGTTRPRRTLTQVLYSEQWSAGSSQGAIPTDSEYGPRCPSDAYDAPSMRTTDPRVERSPLRVTQSAARSRMWAGRDKWALPRLDTEKEAVINLRRAVSALPAWSSAAMDSLSGPGLHAHRCCGRVVIGFRVRARSSQTRPGPTSALVESQEDC